MQSISQFSFAQGLWSFSIFFKKVLMNQILVPRCPFKFKISSLKDSPDIMLAPLHILRDLLNVDIFLIFIEKVVWI